METVTPARVNPLFGDSDPDEIARILREDWRRFSAVAYIVLGMTETWDAAITEIAMIQHAFARNDLDLDLLDDLFMMMYDRVRVLPDMIDRFERLMAALALPVPRTVKRLRDEMAMTPDQKQKRSNREWLASYRAKRDSGKIVGSR
jgi:hypothetical protein